MSGTNQNSIFAPTPLSVANGGTGNHTTLANGQLWIGNGTAIPGIGNITARSDSIIVTNGSGSITIASTGSSISWVPTNSQSTIEPMIPNTGYLVSGSTSNPKLILPANAVIGDTYIIMGSGAPGGYTIGCTALLQSIIYKGNTGNTLYTTDSTASITLVCLTGTANAQKFGVLSINSVGSSSGGSPFTLTTV